MFKVNNKETTTATIYLSIRLHTSIYLFKLGFSPCKIDQPLQKMELQEKKKNMKSISGSCLVRTQR